MLSYGLWRRRYGGDPNALGRTITLDRRPYTIVGIMPASFHFPKRGPQINGEPAQVWTPLALDSFERSQQARGMMYNHTVIGRLRGGVAAEQAMREAGALGPRLVNNYPPILQDPIKSLTVTAAPLTEEFLTALLLLFLFQSRPKSLRILPSGFLPESDEFRALVKDCTLPDVRAKFKALESLKPRSLRAEIGSAARVVNAIFRSPSFLARCDGGFNLSAFLQQPDAKLIRSVGNAAVPSITFRR